MKSYKQKGRKHPEIQAGFGGGEQKPIWALKKMPSQSKLICFFCKVTTLTDVEITAGNFCLYFTKPFATGLYDILEDQLEKDNLEFLYLQKWLAYCVYQFQDSWRGG